MLYRKYTIKWGIKMLGLFIKDFYTAYRQNKWIFLVVLLFALIPTEGKYIYGYSIFSMAMLSTSTMAYDEQAKWNRLAAVMPYTKRELVTSKFLFSYVSVGITIIIVMLARIFWTAVGNGNVSVDISVIIFVTCIAVNAQAISLAIMQRAGTQKGRKLFSFIMVLVIVMVMSWVSSEELMQMISATGNWKKELLALAAITVVINIICIEIGIKIRKIE